MFSTGQIIFAILFALSFIVFISISYNKDKALHEKNYKGVKWVAVVFILFIVFLFIIKKGLQY